MIESPENVWIGLGFTAIAVMFYKIYLREREREREREHTEHFISGSGNFRICKILSEVLVN